jgi:hypothetical protein
MTRISAETAVDVFNVLSWLALAAVLVRKWMDLYNPTWALPVAYLLLLVGIIWRSIRRLRATGVTES